MHLAGHKSPKVTERYAGGLSDDELARMARPAFSMIYGKKALCHRSEITCLGGNHLAILKAKKPEIVRLKRRGGLAQR